VEISSSQTIRRVRLIQRLTIAWMTVEAAVALIAAWRAHSAALLAFGGDSAIEFLSAVIVLWRFKSATVQEKVERRAARMTGTLLLLLAAYVLADSVMTLLGYIEPRPTALGIAILVLAAAIMPWFAKEKRRLSEATGSAALRADAAESALCAYFSLIALAGLAATAVFRVQWADPVAALVIVPFIIREGLEVICGKSCSCSE
jgi:divalent metal cation (Fe/Co/Zn/Cd) transporter